MQYLGDMVSLSFYGRSEMTIRMTEKELNDMARYLAAYLNEEFTREGVGYDVDSSLMANAIAAYIGGASLDW
jgi:hypothetical protein